MKTSLRAYLFGTFEIYKDETSLSLPGSSSARSLLAFLCLNQERPIPRSVLVGTFWPEQTESSARRALSQSLWHIRRSLPNILKTEIQSVQISPEAHLWVDINEFQTLIASYEKATLPKHQSNTDLQQAAQLYRGDLLNGLYDEWIFIERESLRAQYLRVLELLIQTKKSTGHFSEALEYARRFVQADPLNEEIYRSLMQINLALGYPQAALQVFKECQQILDTELGVEPETKTIELVREIKRQSSSTQLPYLPPNSKFQAPLIDQKSIQYHLVGRDQDRIELLSNIEGIFKHMGGATLIEGSAGIGKTRLLQETVRDAEWRGAQALWGGCRETEGVGPYRALIEAILSGLSSLRINQLSQLVDGIWLQTLQHLIPELTGQYSSEITLSELAPNQARDRLKTAFAQLLTAWSQIKPITLVIEDIHWANRDLMEILISLATQFRDKRIVLLMTYRGEDARESSELWEAIQTLDRIGLQNRLLLSGLDAKGSGELIRRALGLASPAPLFEERLHHETSGNPLFLLETLRSLLEENVLTQDANGNWHTPWDKTTTDYGELPMPQAVESVIARRLNNLDTEIEVLLHKCAVLGEHFDFSMLQASSGLETAQLLGLLDELTQRRFLLETEEEYTFSHARVREVIYAQIPAAKRSEYHRRVGEALEQQTPNQIAQLAHHFYQAQIWKKNLKYSQLAGDQAASNYANHEALAHYSRALDLIPVDQVNKRYAVLLAREKIYALLGEREAQTQDLSALYLLAEQLQVRPLQIEIAIRQAKYAEAIGEYEQATKYAQKAVALSNEASSKGAVEGWLLWGVALRCQGLYPQAEEKIGQALSHAKTAHNEQLEANALSALGIARAYQSDYTGAQTYFQQALEIYRRLGDRLGEGKTLNLLGVQQDYLGDYKRAEDFYRQALQIHHQTGDRRGEGDARLNIGVALANLGDNARARQYYQQALAIYNESGHQQGQSWVLGNLGSVAAETGDFGNAQEYFEQALSISRKMGDQQGECAACAQICLNLCSLEDYTTAQHYGQQALNLATEIKDRYLLNYAYLYLGHAYSGLGDWAQAQDAYQHALDIRRELEEFNLAMEALAGLVRVDLTRGELENAYARVEKILAYLAENSLDGCDEPLQIYLICYRALKSAQDHRAAHILKTAHAQLQERAARINDNEMRRSFLENIPHHKELSATYLAWQTEQRGQQIEVRLPKAGAPTGRPLQEDEWVSVNWTPQKPGDDEISNKQEQRQHRLLRLLGEAETQGGAPTLENLSEAMGVSIPTIKRDLAALRKAGHPVQTRGSRSP